MKIDTIQTSFAAGEFASALYGRTDIAQYANACEIVENFLIRPYGTLVSTPGTEYINACKTGGSTSISRLLPFIFSRSDSYIIEVGVSYFRFYTDGAVVVSTGTTPYEVSHTYTASEIPDIHFAQVNDVIYLDHPSHAPARLTRIASNIWTLTDLPFIGGPFFRDNAIVSNSAIVLLTSATITPSGTNGSITLAANANIFTPSGSTLGHLNTLWKIGALVTNSTTGLQEQGYVRITAITNPSTSTATVMSSRLAGTAATTIWAQGSWSDILGWPARVTFHQQRLFHARTVYQPQNIWGSKPFTYEDYSINSGQDDDALDIQLISTESNDIKWLASGSRLIAGTYGGDFAIGSGDDSPMTPSNTNAPKQTSWGSEAVQPQRIGNFFYYFQRFFTKLRELYFDWDQTNSYRSQDKTILAPHVSGVGGFKSFAYQQNPDTVLWAICSNGTLATLTREVDQEIQGWARQVTDGYYESVASIPSQDGPHDEVWVIVKRTINGTDRRYVERFKSQLVPDRQDQCFYVHSGLTYDAFNATTAPTSTSMSFSYPNSTTKLLLHANQFPFIESAQAKTITTFNNAQMNTVTKKFGSGSIFLPNVLGNDSSTKLLLHLENNITDSSPSARGVTSSSMVFSTDIKKFGGYSGLFDGVSSYLSVPASADWNFGTSDLTIDLWAYFNDVSGTQDLLSQAVNGGDNQFWRLFQSNGTSLTFRVANTSGTTTIEVSGSVDLGINRWYHIALVRNSTSFKIYLNGVVAATTTSSVAFVAQASTDINIGRFGPGGSPTFYMNGYIDEIRISTGIARWTSDFTPPEYAYNDLIDYLSVPDHADWSFGTGNFTVDAWVYFTDLTNDQVILGQYADVDNLWYVKKGTGASGNRLHTFFRSSGDDKANYIMASSSSLAINTWTHIAYVRSSTSIKIYINGVSQPLIITTAVSTNDVGNVASALIISQQNSTAVFKGYMDEVRISKGIALWTTDFTPPTIEGTQSGTVALVTTSAAYFSAGNVGKRIRAIDTDGDVVGEITITGYTSSTIVVGTIAIDFDAFAYAAGLWGVSVNSISGLGHLEAETVSALGDGVKDSATKVVSGGSITLASDYFYVIAGLPYVQKIRTLVQEAGGQRGTSQGKIQRINEIALKLNRSYAGFQYGPNENSLDSLVAASPSLYSGVLSNIYFHGDYEVGSRVVIKNSDPLPIELLSLITTIDTQEK